MKTIEIYGEVYNFPYVKIEEDTLGYGFFIAEDGEPQYNEEGHVSALSFINSNSFYEKKVYIDKDDVLNNPMKYINYNAVNESELIAKQAAYIDELQNCILELSQEVYK